MVERASLQLKSDLLATKQELSSKQSQLGLAKSTYPLDVELIMNLTNEVESLKDGVKKLEELQKELGLE